MNPIKRIRAYFADRAKPEMNKVVQPSRRDVLMGAYSSGLTPEKLSSIHYVAEIGQIEQAMTLYIDVIGKDLHLGGTLDKRKGAVAGCP